MSHWPCNQKNKAFFIGIAAVDRPFKFCLQGHFPGIPFIQGLCQAMAGLRHPYYHARETKGMHNDLALWQDFLSFYNEVSFWREDKLNEADLQWAQLDSVFISGAISGATGAQSNGLWSGLRQVW